MNGWHHPAHPALTAEHEALRDAVARFVKKEIVPHVNAWDEAGEFPREMYRRAGAAGILGVGFPEEHGGTPCDLLGHVILAEEIALAGSGGVHASLYSHQIGAPPIAAVGSAALQKRVLPPILAGEKISALAITEPSGGSDVARLRTTARREGDHFVVDGEKVFITSGMRADYYTVAVRTGGPGAAGVSLLLVDRDTPGFTRAKLDKTGWWCSDTAHLRFDGCRVPVDNLIGEENRGFAAIMRNFNAERLGLAAAAVAYAQCCVDDALDWARHRQTFGQALVQHQVIRHKLVDMQTRVAAARALVYDTAWRLVRDPRDKAAIAQLAMTKNFATRAMQHCADEGVQILGGAGFIRGHRIERIYREVKVMTIGGGAEEIMKDLAARQQGW